MIAGWMLWCAAVSALLALAAAALEPVLVRRGRAARWVWLAAMGAAFAAPAAMRLAPAPLAAPPPPVEPAAPTGAPAALSTADVAVAVASARALGGAPSLAALDRPLLVLWGASSLAALLTLAGGAVLLRRRMRGWRQAVVDGRRVLVSPCTGPAVVGFLRGAIVLPAWTLAHGAEERGLMLVHEEEHLRARDPWLLLAGLLAVAAAPWSPALWWKLRRLRLAVEVDCDRRVLRRRGDVAAYGTLLLEIGRRASAGPLAAAALAEPASFLERRIRIMTEPRRASLARTLALCAIAAGAVVSVAALPFPAQPARGGPAVLTAEQTTVASPAVAPSAVAPIPPLVVPAPLPASAAPESREAAPGPDVSGTAPSVLSAADTTRRLTVILQGSTLRDAARLFAEFANRPLEVGAAAAAIRINADLRQVSWPLAIRQLAAAYGLCVSEEGGVPVRVDVCPGATAARPVTATDEEVRRVRVTARIARGDSIVAAPRLVLVDGQEGVVSIRNEMRLRVAARFTPHGGAGMRATFDHDPANPLEFVVQNRSSITMDYGEYTIVLETEVLRDDR